MNALETILKQNGWTEVPTLRTLALRAASEDATREELRDLATAALLFEREQTDQLAYQRSGRIYSLDS